MDFKVLLKNGEYEYRSIRLRIWDGEHYSPDFFYDFDVAEIYSKEEGSGAYIVTEEQYEMLTDWWRDTIANANNGVWTGMFGDYNAEEKGELVLDAN